MPRFVLGYLDWAERLRTGEQANFQEKAHSVKADVAAPWWSSATTPYPSRYASIHTLRVSPLSGDSVHYGIRLFGLWRNDGLKVLPLKGLSWEALVTACKTGCPVARSVKGSIEISSELDLT